MPPNIIKISTDFSRYPGGRKEADGENSGEEFRKKFLEPILQSNVCVKIDLDGLFTIPPSFLDEAFGTIVGRIGKTKFDELFELVLTDDPDALIELTDIYEKRQKLFNRSGRGA